MEQIDKKPKQNMIDTTSNVKKRVARGVTDNISIFASVFIVFIAVVVFFTNIKLSDIKAVAELSLVFAILWFCSFAMYVNCSDAGVKNGRRQNIYTTAESEYNALKKSLKDSGNAGRLNEFCEWYIRDELIRARSNIMIEAGISYNDYLNLYIGKSAKDLTEYSLTKAQLKAISSANKLKPLHLNAERILRRGRDGAAARRNPLGVSPETKRKTKVGLKAATSIITSCLTGVIVLDVIINPSWATFAAMCLKLLPIGMSAFKGYTMGYNNIVEDTVNYINDQADLIDQCNKYISKYPEPQHFEENKGSGLREKPTDKAPETVLAPVADNNAEVSAAPESQAPAPMQEGESIKKEQP